MIETLAIYWPLVVSIVFLLVAAYLQLATGRVPNVYTLGTAAAGLGVSGLVQSGIIPGDGGIVPSLVAGAIGFVALLPFWAHFGLGAACVKSNAAFGVWLGIVFNVGTAVLFVGVGTIVSVVITTIAAQVYARIRPHAQDFPAQVTLSLATVVAVLGMFAACISS